MNVPPIKPRGIEHIGITVPDIDAAERFLQSAFDAQTLYSLVREDEPSMGGPSISSQNGLADGTAMKALRMLRLGNGPNVELFELTGYRQHASAIVNDVGLTHFGLYCDDLEASVERFKKAGGTMLHGPNDLVRQEGGDGNRFWFGRCPWGTLIEFIQFPHMLHYDASVDTVRWRPEPADQSETGA